MCINPIKIKNPNYQRSSFSLVGADIVLNPSNISSSNEFIDVPCCKCVECRNTYYNSILQRGIVESLSSYLYFVTLTYDDKHIPSIKLPNGKVVYYTNYEHIQNMFKRFRANNVLDRDFRYLCVNEYGDKRHRPHAHIILFVHKKIDDDINTPHIIERILFNNLQRFYAVNVGTRKQPIYERLFTYQIKRTPQGIRTNYFVKYVEQSDSLNRSLTDTKTNVKTLRYLLGYISKGSKFDNVIKTYLDAISDDLLRKKLSIILQSRVRYSKGFGLGFDEHGKNYTPRHCVKSSLFTALYSLNKYTLDVDSFISLRPTIYEDMQHIIFLLQTKTYKSFQEFRNLLPTSELFEAFVYICILFPRYIHRLYRSKCNINDLSHISYLFRFLHPRKYLVQYIVTSEFSDDLVSSYIRKGVEYGISQGVPFIAFPLYSSQTYMPLCKFYCERYCTHVDTLRMYDSIGVTNFDEWCNKFHHYVNTNKVSKFKGNELKYEVDTIQHVKTPNVTTTLLDIYKKV